MSIQKEMKPYWIASVFFGLAFLVLFSIRIGTFDEPTSETPAESVHAAPERDSWMKIMQNGRKIGFTRTVFSRTEKGYRIDESLYMRLKTMGLTQEVRLRTDAALFRDLSLSSFTFHMDSGRFDFKAEGHVFGKRLHIRTETGGDVGGMKIRLGEKPYIAAGILEAVIASGLTPGEKRVFHIFDPAVMARQKVTVVAEGKETVEVMGIATDSTKITMECKGVSQTAWIGENGDVLRQKGLLGISMEKTSRADALAAASLSQGEDLTVAASIPSNVKIEAPERLLSAVYEIGGVHDSLLEKLDGGRQRFENGVLTVAKENAEEIRNTDFEPSAEDFPRKYLAPGTFIQSGDKRIKALVEQIVAKDDTPVERVKKIMDWIHGNIERRPVLSIPDALSTLANRAGDCNEHSVLTAALARAAGVPARVESGVVYLNGAFFYHAWNTVFTGEWVTVDSLFQQFPADVTHIRFSRGTGESQADMTGLLGKLEIKVLKTSENKEGGS